MQFPKGGDLSCEEGHVTGALGLVPPTVLVMMTMMTMRRMMRMMMNLNLMRTMMRTTHAARTTQLTQRLLWMRHRRAAMWVALSEMFHHLQIQKVFPRLVR